MSEHKKNHTVSITSTNDAKTLSIIIPEIVDSNNELSNNMKKVISETDNDSVERPVKKLKINHISKNNNSCPGCYPVFQDNQEGHIGPNGCLGDYTKYM